MLHIAMMKSRSLKYSTIFLFWAPLAMTWLMMACEGPFLAAIVARLAEPKINLAAHGVAIHIAIIIEAPVIMIMTASTALSKNRQDFCKLRNYTIFLNSAITLIMVGLLATPAMDYITMNMMGLRQDVAGLIHKALIILIPWPASIGYRRFYQGLLIRNNQTRRVAYGTVTRFFSMAACALVLYFFFDLPGALISASALSTGVVFEAAAARIMARGAVKKVLAQEGDPGDALTYREITRFYFPLALTCTIGLAAHPMVTFFVGKSRMALDSLAIIPVVNSLTFVFIALALSFTEVVVAKAGEHIENFRPLRNFALMLAVALTFILGMVVFSPLSKYYLTDFSGLTAELTRFSALPAKIAAFIPALTVFLCFQRAILVKLKNTNPVTWGTIIEIAGIAIVLYIGIKRLDLIGALAAYLALNIGRLAGVVYLIFPLKGQTDQPRVRERAD